MNNNDNKRSQENTEQHIDLHHLHQAIKDTREADAAGKREVAEEMLSEEEYNRLK